jgi:hypothetical protein
LVAIPAEVTAAVGIMYRPALRTNGKGPVRRAKKMLGATAPVSSDPMSWPHLCFL